MADFTVKATRRGPQVVAWEDELSNPYPGLPLRSYQALVGQVIEFHAVVDGVDAPLDSALGGRLFSADCCEGTTQPHWFTSDRSSIVRCSFAWCGHFVIAIRRPGGGAELIPIDVVGELS
jgi:hypothetical protein